MEYLRILESLNPTTVMSSSKGVVCNEPSDPRGVQRQQVDASLV